MLSMSVESPLQGTAQLRYDDKRFRTRVSETESLTILILLAG